MTWLMRSLRVWWLLLAATVLGLSSALLVDAAISVPTLDQSVIFQQMPLNVILPLLLLVMSAAAAAHASPEATALSVRPHPLIVNALTLMVAMLFAGVNTLTSWATGQDPDLAAARNVFGYSALLFASQNLVSVKYASLVPAVYVVVATVFGRVGGVIQPWAWPVMPGELADLLVSLLVATGIAAASGALASRTDRLFYGIDGVTARLLRRPTT